MKPLRKVLEFINRTCDFLVIPAGILLIATVAVVSANVIMRYGLGRSIAWAIEVPEYALLFITFLGTAWLLRRGGHISIELVVSRLKPEHQAVTSIISSIICAIISLTLTWYGIKVTWDHFQAGYRLTSPLGPPSFLIQSIIPVGSFLLFTQFLRMACEQLTASKRHLDRNKEGGRRSR